MIVWISGPTGGGKSSLARVFRSLGFAVIQEKLPQKLFAEFTCVPVRHCAPLQEEIMHSRFRAWEEASNAPIICFDRSLDEDVCVFCRLHRELGLLTENQFQRLRDLAASFQNIMPKPDLIVFVSPSASVFAERVTTATHPPIIVRNLQRQLDLYAEWLRTRPENVIKVDNSDCNGELFQRLTIEGDSKC